MKERRESKQRGVFEKVPGSGIWWIRYFDQFGKKRREKAGSKSVAIKLYGKRKQQVLEGKKLPELFRKPSINFGQLSDDALAYSKRNKRSYKTDLPRFANLKDWFGKHPADDLTPKEIENRLASVGEKEKWAPSTFNHYRSLVSLSYRLGILNRKVTTNPARSVTHRREDNNRVRFLTEEEGKKSSEGRAGQVARAPAGTGSRDQYRHSEGEPIRINVGHGRLEVPRASHSAYKE